MPSLTAKPPLISTGTPQATPTPQAPRKPPPTDQDISDEQMRLLNEREDKARAAKPTPPQFKDFASLPTYDEQVSAYLKALTAWRAAHPSSRHIPDLPPISPLGTNPTFERQKKEFLERQK